MAGPFETLVEAKLAEETPAGQVIARWETSGKDFIELRKSLGDYS